MSNRIPRFFGCAVWLACGPAWAQGPAYPPPPPVPPRAAPGHGYRHVGPIRHVGRAVHEHFIGDPELFNVPPLGYSLYQTMSAQTAKANVHNFMLYRSDFVAGTNTLSPSGAWRLSYLASRLPTWSGPVIIEWTPEQPELAAVRRDAVIGMLRGSNLAVADNRIVVGPSPYTGLIGVDAANNYNILIQRDLRAPTIYSVSPISTANFGGGAR